MSRMETRSLQQVAFDQLSASMPMAAAPKAAEAKPAPPQRCVTR
jgi:hypothetical protein